MKMIFFSIMNGGTEELSKVTPMLFAKRYSAYNSLRISWSNKPCDNGILYEI